MLKTLKTSGSVLVYSYMFFPPPPRGNYLPKALLPTHTLELARSQFLGCSLSTTNWKLFRLVNDLVLG